MPAAKSAPMQIQEYKDGSLRAASYDQKPFGTKVRYRALKDAVDMYQANQRQGTLNTRGRSEVAGSRKKPWKQKHTGRARAGDRKSPLWRGGGIVFGPKARDYSYHMPIKARRVALRSALAGKLRDGEVVIASLASFTKPSAKSARALLAGLGAPRRALIVLREHNEAAWKSFRNFPGVNVRAAQDVCALDVLAGGLVVAEREALDRLAARVGESESKAAKS